MGGLFLLVHDIIKIVYVEQGYLPDFPYHLISDKEMFDAFILAENNFFTANYPCPDTMVEQYNALIVAISYHLYQYLQHQTSSASESSYTLPDWIYSYMLGIVISPTSREQERHDLFVLLDMDNLDDEFTPEIYTAIYRISTKWTYKLPLTERIHRPPTMFGEPHVIKSLRLLNL